MSIKSIGQEMAKQDNRCGQYPLYAIQVDCKNYVNYRDDWEYKERPNTDVIDDLGEYLCARCKMYVDEHNTVPETCQGESANGARECDEEAFWYYNIEQKLEVAQSGVFFTDKACQDHIDQNSHHYENPRVYGIGAWRNPEMVEVMQHIIIEAGEKIPSHYS